MGENGIILLIVPYYSPHWRKITASGPLGREWCPPQWAGSSHTLNLPRQTPVDMRTDIVSQMTLSCVKLTTEADHMRVNGLLFTKFGHPGNTNVFV